jgi:hypothetical protein
MGRAILPPGCLSVPDLGRRIGRRHTTLYKLIRQGRGPRLTPVERVPGYSYKGPARSHYVRIPDAIAWLQARPDADRWSDAIRTLRIENILQHVRAGVPLPPPPPVPVGLGVRLTPSFDAKRFYKGLRSPARAPQGAYEPRTDGLLT